MHTSTLHRAGYIWWCTFTYTCTPMHKHIHYTTHLFIHTYKLKFLNEKKANIRKLTCITLHAHLYITYALHMQYTYSYTCTPIHYIYTTHTYLYIHTYTLDHYTYIHVHLYITYTLHIHSTYIPILAHLYITYTLHIPVHPHLYITSLHIHTRTSIHYIYTTHTLHIHTYTCTPIHYIYTTHTYLYIHTYTLHHYTYIHVHLYITYTLHTYRYAHIPSVFIDVDFSENFDIPVKYEPQSMHWYHESVTVHSGIMFVDGEKYYLPYLSDDKSHDQHFVDSVLDLMLVGKDLDMHTHSDW